MSDPHRKLNKDVIELIARTADGPYRKRWDEFKNIMQSHNYADVVRCWVHGCGNCFITKEFSVARSGCQREFNTNDIFLFEDTDRFAKCEICIRTSNLCSGHLHEIADHYKPFCLRCKAKYTI